MRAAHHEVSGVDEAREFNPDADQAAGAARGARGAVSGEKF
jgi:hypothetical protein